MFTMYNASYFFGFMTSTKRAFLVIKNLGDILNTLSIIFIKKLLKSFETFIYGNQSISYDRTD